MFGYVDEHGNPLNMGGGPQRIVVLGVPNQNFQQQQQQAQEEAKHLTQEMILDRHAAMMRQMHGAARHSETKILLDGLSEIRKGLEQWKIGSGDKGGEGRPAMETAFDEINQGKLQLVYLSLSEKYLNYCNDMMRELGINTTDHANKEKKPKKKNDESVQQ